MIARAHRSLIDKSAAAGLLIALSLPNLFYPSVEASPAGGPEKQSLDLKTTNGKDAATSPQTAKKTSDKRKEIVTEAVSSLRETQDALKKLDEGKNKDALASLEKATGKLDLVLARDPKAALIPVDVRVITQDVYGSTDAIKQARLEAQKLLTDGQLQQARVILANMASETIISTTNLPVASYPGALKNAAKLIDENKIGEAKEVLQTALNTLVVTDIVIPLPVMRAGIALKEADKLATVKDRTTEQDKQLNKLLATAENEIGFAEELGYGKKADFDAFHKQIDQIRQKTSNGKFGNGFFDQIRTYMESMTKDSQHRQSK